MFLAVIVYFFCPSWLFVFRSSLAIWSSCVFLICCGLLWVALCFFSTEIWISRPLKRSYVKLCIYLTFLWEGKLQNKDFLASNIWDEQHIQIKTGRLHFPFILFERCKHTTLTLARSYKYLECVWLSKNTVLGCLISNTFKTSFLFLLVFQQVVEGCLGVGERWLYYCKIIS